MAVLFEENGRDCTIQCNGLSDVHHHTGWHFSVPGGDAACGLGREQHHQDPADGAFSLALGVLAAFGVYGWQVPDRLSNQKRQKPMEDVTICLSRRWTCWTVGHGADSVCVGEPHKAKLASLTAYWHCTVYNATGQSACLGNAGCCTYSVHVDVRTVVTAMAVSTPSSDDTG